MKLFNLLLIASLAGGLKSMEPVIKWVQEDPRVIDGIEGFGHCKAISCQKNPPSEPCFKSYIYPKNNELSSDFGEVKYLKYDRKNCEVTSEPCPNQVNPELEDDCDAVLIINFNKIIGMYFENFREENIKIFSEQDIELLNQVIESLEDRKFIMDEILSNRIQALFVKVFRNDNKLNLNQDVIATLDEIISNLEKGYNPSQEDLDFINNLSEELKPIKDKLQELVENEEPENYDD
jgi:hypothetical protein